MPLENKPFIVEAKAGETLYFCCCAKSNIAPFCDGSHEGSGKLPHTAEIKEDKTLYLCGCAKTKTIPFCDGTHKSL